LKTLGDHIRKRRLDLGLLQREVAAKLSVTESTIWNWESNTTDPALRLLPAIIRIDAPKLPEFRYHFQYLRRRAKRPRRIARRCCFVDSSRLTQNGSEIVSAVCSLFCRFIRQPFQYPPSFPVAEKVSWHVPVVHHANDTPLRAAIRALSTRRRFGTLLTPGVGCSMPYELQGAALLVPVLTAIAMLVKYERRVKRWFLKHPRRRRPAASRRSVLY
jgi:transcriptional regulator with XRE-family HTH domain